MSRQFQGALATTSEPSPSPGVSYLTKNLNGCEYYSCTQCSLVSLDQNAIEQHVRGDDSPNNCRKKSKLQCFGCANIFFAEDSLLSHAIHDHQMTESCAATLIRKLNVHNEKKNSTEQSGINNENTDIKAVSGIEIPQKSFLQSSKSDVITREPEIDNRRLDISIPLEQEIINDLNDCENDSDEDEDYKASEIPKNCIEKQNSRKKKDVRVLGFKCGTESCNVRLLAEENISYHKKCHNAEAKGETEAFRCPECQEFLSNRWSTMAGHLWRSHLVDMELHTCDLCNYKTPSLSKLIHQHRGIHGNERPFVCEFCGKGFKTSKQLRSHKTSHKSDDKNTFQCDKCQRVFKTCRLLKLHGNSAHKDCKPFTCNFCDYSAATRSGLKLHLRRHTGEKPFSCDQCAYSTGDHNSLRRHKLRHLGLKPYNCPHCSYACIQSSTYKVHLKNKHPGLDEGIMFSCQYCPYRTLKREKLLTHITKHTEFSRDGTRNAKD
ncbi:zinc finger protein 429 [Diachasma alloeum]|uniref:zinc finger protein 429 n=1 Tax=Diachasma alloeum TaxID=454923 RepID=UPI00073828D9|nr:zinc finger protein 429 [Diachasma alloeum]